MGCLDEKDALLIKMYHSVTLFNSAVSKAPPVSTPYGDVVSIYVL